LYKNVRNYVNIEVGFCSKMCQNQSWLPTKGKLNDNRQRQSSTNARQPTTNNQEPKATTDSDTRQFKVNNQQLTPDKQQRTTNSERYSQLP
jgi:hypothetical protein